MVDKVQEVELLQELDVLDITDQQSEDCEYVSKKVNIGTKILNIIHFNIRSIKKNFDQMTVFLETYNLLSCDIIILSESWQIVSNDFDIEGFKMYYSDGKYNQNDGVVVFIKSHLNIKMINNMTYAKSGITLIRFIVSVVDRQYGISCVYRPPSTVLPYFIEDLENHLTNVCNQQNEILIGDININLLAIDSPETNNYLSVLMSHGYFSLINGPTRVTLTTKSCIDHIFMKRKKDPKFTYSPFILDTDVTDHLPIFLSIHKEDGINNININHSNIVSKTIKVLNNEKVNNLLSFQDWTTGVLNVNDVETATQNFYSIIDNIIKESEETKVIRHKTTKKIKPWITTGIVCSIKNRDKIKKQLKKSYSIEKEQQYKIYRNFLNKLINKCKNDYYKAKIEESQYNMGKIYKVINEVTNQVNNKGPEIHNIKDKNQHFNNNKDLANYCNNYFTNVGINMLNNIKKPKNERKIMQHNLSSMFLGPTCKNEIIKYIFSLKNNSAPGIDSISSRFVKRFHIHFISPLIHIINLIFKTSIVPSQFKTSIISPIYKAGDKTDIGNYRPISIINSFTKIFEKCLKDRLISFLQVNNLLSQKQFGFIGGLSTSDALYELTRQVSENLDKHKKCLAVFLDLAKAFDTVPHDILLEVLNSYGIRGPVLEVFGSYLRDRSQTLKINGVFSDPAGIKIGIPQGTVIGPILFIIYINSLTNLIMSNGSLISYADDTVAVFSGASWEDAKEAAERGMARIKDWLDSFRLSLNSQKTNYIAFTVTSVNRPPFDHIELDATLIDEVPHVRYLGVIVDKHLKWDQHILKLTSNIRKLIFRFYILRNILNSKLLMMVYRSLVESLLRYGVIVWGGLYNNSLKQLNVVQNYILRVMNRKEKRYSSQLLYSEDVFNVRSIYILSTCIYAHKSNNFKAYVNHQHYTRNNINKHLKLPNFRKNLGHRFISFLAPKFYNILPNDIRQIQNVKRFSRKCRKYIFLNMDKFRFF